MNALLSALLDLVFAPVCLGCDGAIAPADSVRLVCRRCRSLLRALPEPACARCGAPRLRTGRLPEPTCGECRDWPPSLRAARSACVLHPPGDRLVHRLKYHGWRALAGFMAERMAALELPWDVREEAALVVPVPTTRTRLRERGYNQAGLLAEALAQRTGREARPLLERTGARTTQTALQPAARGANVAGAFRIAGTEAAREVRGAHLLLVDDVLTTGATAAECTRTLVSAGARCVSVITFARALDARRLTAT
ncbi:MAG TPA: ComF family protein [Longimicrobiales bacterium]